MANDGLEIHGLDDIQKQIGYIVANYPYESETLLKQMGNKFRKSVKDRTPEHKVSKAKLAKEIELYGEGGKKKTLKNSYKVSQVKGYGKDLYVEFHSTSPHFHLVERGHNLVINGKRKGFVQGERMLEKTSQEYQNEYPKEVEKMVTRMVKKLL